VTDSAAAADSTPETPLLRAALGRALTDHFGARRGLVGMARRPYAYRTSFALEELTVRLADGSTLALLFKDLSLRSLLENARLAKPDFLYNPLREIETYRQILAPNQLSAPIFYGAAVDPALDRYWLFVEKVPGVELFQVGDIATWQAVAQWLAAMHTRFHEDAWRSADRIGHLLTYTRDFYWQWLHRAREFVGRTDQPADLRGGLDTIAKRYGEVVERLAGLPTTLLHGEFYASNVLVQETPTGLRVSPVDWELAAIGPGLIDLAALTAGSWTPEQKAALALAYHAALPITPNWPPTPELFLMLLDCCHLHLAIQWLGWSPDWSPPKEHAQNWLREAVRVADRLKL
jgi:hypothetical protein